METQGSSKSRTQAPYFALGITITFWGLAWPIARIVSRDFSNHIFTAAALRFTFVLPFLFFIILISERNFSLPRSLHPKLLAFGFIQIFVFNFLFFSGISLTSASDASLIIATTPTFTALIASRIYPDEKFSKQIALGIALSFIGVLLIFNFSPNTQVETRILGNLIILLGSAIWAIYTAFSRPMYHEISPAKFQLYSTFYGWIFLLVFALFEQPWNITYRFESFSGIVYLGICAAAISNTFYSYGIKKLGPTKASIFINLVPFVAVISSVLILGERFNLVYVFAFILIAAGVSIVNSKMHFTSAELFLKKKVTTIFRATKKAE